MRAAAAQAVPLAPNGNGHHGGANGNGANGKAPVLGPRLTAQGLRKLLERENNPCGPGLLAARIRAVAEAEQQDEAKLLAGALEDLAAAAVGYSYRVRADAGIWPRPVPGKLAA